MSMRIDHAANQSFMYLELVCALSKVGNVRLRFLPQWHLACSLTSTYAGMLAM